MVPECTERLKQDQLARSNGAVPDAVHLNDTRTQLHGSPSVISNTPLSVHHVQRAECTIK